MYSYLMIENIKKRDRKNIECSLELKELNECIKNNKIDKINKIDCHKLFYDYTKCDDSIQLKRSIEYITK